MNRHRRTSAKLRGPGEVLAAGLLVLVSVTGCSSATPVSNASPIVTATLAPTSAVGPTASTAVPATAPAATAAAPNGAATSAIAVGGNHACALPGDGTVRCWGYDYAGQLGNGSTANGPISTPVTVVAGPGSTSPLSGVSAITAGFEHTCALLRDGSVKCWGSNGAMPPAGPGPPLPPRGSGQLGDGTTTDRSAPVTVIAGPGSTSALSGVTAIAAGDLYTCALLGDGTVKCWGDAPQGNNQSACSASKLCSSAPVTVTAAVGSSSPLSGVTAITAGDYQTCGLLGDGTMKCWGANFEGALGDGATTASLVPVSVTAAVGSSTPLAGVTAVAASHGDPSPFIGTGILYEIGHTCALLVGGTVKCWGAGELGQLGNGNVGNLNGQVAPASVIAAAGSTSFLSGVSAIAAGAAHTCALMGDGTVECWGATNLGAPGTTNLGAPNAGSGAPTTIVAASGSSNVPAGVTAIAAGGFETCAILADGSVTCWVGFAGPAITVPGLLIAAPAATSAPTAAPGPSAALSLTPSPTVALGPVATVQAFYDWYDSGPQSIADIVARPELTPGFVTWLKSFNGPASPIVCAQDVPAWVKAGPAVISGTSAVVKVDDSFSLPAGGIPVHLAHGPTGWQISAIDCGF